MTDRIAALILALVNQAQHARQRPMKSYRLILRTHLDKGWLTVLPTAAYYTSLDNTGRPITMLTLTVADQAEFIGLINELHDLGIHLVATTALEEEAGGQLISPVLSQLAGGSAFA